MAPGKSRNEHQGTQSVSLSGLLWAVVHREGSTELLWDLAVYSSVGLGVKQSTRFKLKASSYSLSIILLHMTHSRLPKAAPKTAAHPLPLDNVSNPVNLSEISVSSARWSFHAGFLARQQPSLGAVGLLQCMGSGFHWVSCSSGSCSSSLQIREAEEFVSDFSSDTELCKHSCCR